MNNKMKPIVIGLIIVAIVLGVGCGMAYLLHSDNEKQAIAKNNSAVNAQTHNNVDNVQNHNNTKPEVANNTKTEVTNNAKPETEKATNEQEKEKTEEKKEESKTSGEIVTSAIHEKYHVPQINLEFENIKKINKKLTEEIESLYQEAPGLSIKYKYYINRNVLSLAISADTNTDNKNYKVYNVDRNNGNTLSNEEIIKIKGLTTAEYEKKLQTICENTFKARFAELHSLDGTLLNKTKAYWNINTPLFLDGDGTINVIATFVTEIGSGYVIEPLDTQI